jgi:hypothetical protein
MTPEQIKKRLNDLRANGANMRELIEHVKDLSMCGYDEQAFIAHVSHKHILVISGNNPIQIYKKED